MRLSAQTAVDGILETPRPVIQLRERQADTGHCLFFFSLSLRSVLPPGLTLWNAGEGPAAKQPGESSSGGQELGTAALAASRARRSLGISFFSPTEPALVPSSARCCSSSKTQIGSPSHSAVSPVEKSQSSSGKLCVPVWWGVGLSGRVRH